MRLLVADPFDVDVLEELRILGVEISSQPDLTKDSLADALEGVGILIVGDTVVDAKAIEGAPHLNLIIRAGLGVTNVDVAAASERGIYVAECPGQIAVSVAELTLAFMFALDRGLVDATLDLREGRWRPERVGAASGLAGKTLGVAGFGSVGRAVAARGRALGMEVVAWSRSLTASRASKAQVGFAASLVELARKSDVLSIHLPLLKQTKGIVSRHVLEALPERAIVINTADANLVDNDALVDVAKSKSLRIGLDVFSQTPPSDEGSSFDEPALKLPYVYATPRMGAQTAQSKRAVAQDAVRIIRSFLTEEDVPNVVNISATTPSRYVIVARLQDKVGVLSNTLNVLKLHGLNVEEISNTVFEGAKATCTKLYVSARPSESCLREIRAFDEVLHVDVVSMPNLA